MISVDMGVTFNVGQPRTRVACNQHLGVRHKLTKPWTVAMPRAMSEICTLPGRRLSLALYRSGRRSLVIRQVSIHHVTLLRQRPVHVR